MCEGLKVDGKVAGFFYTFPKAPCAGLRQTALTQHGFYSLLVSLSCFNTAFSAFYLGETNLKNNKNCQ